MENLSAKSLFELIAKDKQTIESFTLALQQDIEDELIDPLKMHCNLTHLVKCLSNLKSVNEKNALNEFDKFGEKQIEMHGFKLQQKEAGVKYDFSKCGHKVYESILSEVKEKQEKQKDLEKTMKTLKGMTIITDEDTGETFEVYPPAKSSKTIVQVSAIN